MHANSHRPLGSVRRPNHRRNMVRNGAIHDVCKARLETLSSVCLYNRMIVERASGLTTVQVVFKARIVLHTMVRNGATDNVLQYLSSSDVLRLKNVSGQWEGYNAPKNLQHYALYLNTRVRFYRDLKRDAIRVQSETSIPQLCKFVDRSEKSVSLFGRMELRTQLDTVSIELVRGGQLSFKLYPLPLRYGLQTRLWELEVHALS
ncbi:hypothetical protein EDB92DRAFT_819561 [Lactarius akahatsu]|uniref:AP180 N-terminal homology (ANTH) domain-containing protein n=1 Tax=Lactarius akahatsu TaxID=416441 RepID=A0AAD4LFK1_9AGAM|nr:hypothetical protein EDB92DRAFT_819561 [Lactarius akahatsu]